MPWWIDRTSALRRQISRLEVQEIQRFGHSGLALLLRHDVLVLETTGRRTGFPRRTPVAHLAYDGGHLVGGGAGGQARTPDWVHNLRANPNATIDLGRGDLRFVIADEPVGAERDAAVAALTSRWPEVLRYERWSGRPLPVFVLRPVQ